MPTHPPTPAASLAEAAGRSASNAHCGKCGAEFRCDPGDSCWCAQRPLRPMPENAAACLCPACFDLK